MPSQNQQEELRLRNVKTGGMHWIDYQLADDSQYCVQSIWCSVCRKHSKERDSESPYVKGTTNVKKDSVDSHAKGSLHRYAIEAQAISDKRKHNELTPIEQGFKNMDSDLFERIKKLFSTAAYTGINELPFTQYVKALELQQVNYGDSTLASTVEPR